MKNSISYQIKTAIVAGSTLLLSACGIFGGGDDDEPKVSTQEDKKDRISVLTSTSLLEADDSLNQLPVRIPAPYRNLSWPQAGGSVSHANYHLAFGGTPRQIWSTRIGQGNQAYERMVAGPVAADGLVYAMDVKGTVSAVRLDTGRQVWQTELKMKGERSNVGYGGGVAYHKNMVYATSGFGFIVALDATTGREIWRSSVDNPFRGAPTATADLVFAQTNDNQLFAFDSSTGEELWDQVGITENAGMLGAASPAYVDGTVVTALSSGELLALLSANGRILWQDTLTSQRRLTPLVTLSDVDGHPVIDRDKVYALSHSGRMVAIDMRSGERSWEAEVAGVNMPWVAGNFAFVVTIDSQLVAVTLGDGRIRWMTQLQRFEDQDDRTGLIKWNGPVLAGDRLIVTSSHGYALSLSPYTGEVISGVELPAGTTTEPIVVDGTLLVLTEEAELVAFR